MAVYPPEDGSDRRETLAKCVSDDSRHLIFRRPKIFRDEIVGAKSQHEIKNRQNCSMLKNEKLQIT